MEASGSEAGPGLDAIDAIGLQKFTCRKALQVSSYYLYS